MRKIFLAVVFFCSPVTTFADSFKMTFNQVVALRAALVALDGAPQIIKDGARETTVIVPYKFKAGLRLLISRNIVSADKLINVVRISAAPLNAVVQRLQADKASQTEIDKAAAPLNALGEEEQTVDLEPIKTTELLLDQNQIPPSSLAAMNAILDQESVK